VGGHLRTIRVDRRPLVQQSSSNLLRIKDDEIQAEKADIDYFAWYNVSSEALLLEVLSLNHTPYVFDHCV
jgi:hypothetical protein